MKVFILFAVNLNQMFQISCVTSLQIALKLHYFSFLAQIIITLNEDLVDSNAWYYRDTYHTIIMVDITQIYKCTECNRRHDKR